MARPPLDPLDKMRPVTIQMSARDSQNLDELAERQGRSRASTVRWLVARALTEPEMAPSVGPQPKPAQPKNSPPAPAKEPCRHPPHQRQPKHVGTRSGFVCGACHTFVDA